MERLRRRDEAKRDIGQQVGSYLRWQAWGDPAAIELLPELEKQLE